jgi:phosphoserine phosphatase
LKRHRKRSAGLQAKKEPGRQLFAYGWNVEFLTAEAVVGRIETALATPDARARGAALAFDGDGTLWSGDVGDDFFLATLDANRYSPPVIDAMRALGRASGLDGVDHDAGVVVARRLFEGYLSHVVAEDLMCEVIGWACAGWRRDEVEALARDVLARTALEGRRRAELRTVIDWARGAGVETFLVSASPRPIIEAAGAPLGFDGAHIVATTAPFEDGVMLRDVVRPIPYGPGKASLLAPHLAGRRLLAAFGDNVFDVPMLEAAELGVVVEPKPRLLAHMEANASWKPVRLRVG